MPDRDGVGENSREKFQNVVIISSDRKITCHHRGRVLFEQPKR